MSWDYLQPCVTAWIPSPDTVHIHSGKWKDLSPPDGGASACTGPRQPTSLVCCPHRHVYYLAVRSDHDCACSSLHQDPRREARHHLPPGLHLHSRQCKYLPTSARSSVQQSLNSCPKIGNGDQNCTVSLFSPWLLGLKSHHCHGYSWDDPGMEIF